MKIYDEITWEERTDRIWKPGLSTTASGSSATPTNSWKSWKAP